MRRLTLLIAGLVFLGPSPATDAAPPTSVTVATVEWIEQFDPGVLASGPGLNYKGSFDREHYPILDLRVDAHAEPIGELRRIHALYKPYIPLYYHLRPKRPDIAPSQAEWVSRSRPSGSHRAWSFLADSAVQG